MSTTVMDIILNTPLKLLSSDSQFSAAESKDDQLRVAYDVLSPYYNMHLESAWPRSYRQKCDEKSEKYRNAGNTMFSKSKLREALRYLTIVFNQSMLTLPISDCILSQLCGQLPTQNVLQWLLLTDPPLILTRVTFSLQFKVREGVI